MRGYALLSVVSVVLLSSCAAVVPGHMYSRWDARTPWTVEEGTVVEVDSAQIEGYASGIGVFGGGFIGGSLGSAVGMGAGTNIAQAVGAVAGAIVGKETEEAVTAQKAWEILVRIDQGKDTLAIVQPADVEFAPGEKVRVYSRPDGSARIVKL